MPIRTPEDRADQAVALRVAGHPYRLIGQQLNVDPMTAWRWVQHHIDAGGPHAEQLRTAELGRLDRQLEHLTQRRAALLGDQPVGATR